MMRTSLPQITSELYRHAKEPIFFLLIIGSESILMHDDNWGVMCTAFPRNAWEQLLDNSDEVGFLARKLLVVPRHGQHPDL
jgi:hypothetical protein